MLKKWPRVSFLDPGASLGCTREFLWVGDRSGRLKKFSIKRRVLLKDYGEIFAKYFADKKGQTMMSQSPTKTKDVNRGRHDLPGINQIAISYITVGSSKK